jgi:hypothetical protein
MYPNLRFQCTYSDAKAYLSRRGLEQLPNCRACDRRQCWFVVGEKSAKNRRRVGEKSAKSRRKAAKSRRKLANSRRKVGEKLEEK